MMSVRRLLAAVALGVVLGLFSWWGDRLPPEPGGATAVVITLGSLPGPWLVVAFTAGAISGRARSGALAGLLALGAAVATYYVVRTPSEGSFFGGVFIAWLVVAALAGPVFGLAGGAWRTARRRWSTAGVALLGGALLGEAALLAADANPYSPFFPGVPAYTIAGLEGMLGIGLPPLLALAGERWLALGLTLLAAFAVAVATLAIV
jgi:hypothetical protein